MLLNYTTPGKVRIDMREYIEKMLEDLSDKYGGAEITLAGEHLFDVNPDQNKLDETRTQEFHHVVAQLLFLCKRDCPDIQTAISF